MMSSPNLNNPERPGLILIGVKGLVIGEKFFIPAGQTAVVGRSSVCDISLRNIPAVLNLRPADKNAGDAFRAVSSRHCVLAVHPNRMAVIKNLSPNGLFVDDAPVREFHLDLSKSRGNTLLRLATVETFALQWGTGQAQSQSTTEEFHGRTTQPYE